MEAIVFKKGEVKKEKKKKMTLRSHRKLASVSFNNIKEEVSVRQHDT